MRHRFESLVADAGDPNELGPDEWNDVHAIASRSVQLVAGAATITFTAEELEIIFGNDDPDALYQVLLGWDADETIRWASKTAAGFDLVSNNGGSTANVDLWVVRQRGLQ